MEVNGKGKLSNLIVVGDRVLIKPVKHDKTSKGGLLLPPGYQEKEDGECVFTSHFEVFSFWNCVVSRLAFPGKGGVVCW